MKRFQVAGLEVKDLTVTSLILENVNRSLISRLSLCLQQKQKNSFHSSIFCWRAVYIHIYVHISLKFLQRYTPYFFFYMLDSTYSLCLLLCFLTTLVTVLLLYFYYYGFIYGIRHAEHFQEIVLTTVNKSLANIMRNESLYAYVY